MTEAQIDKTLKAARDSVWVIENEIEKLVAGATPTLSIKDTIGRNAEHLKLIVANDEIVASGKNIDDLIAAIATGEAKIAENIWPEPEAVEDF